MTLRQKELIKELPKSNNNLTKAAKKVGYSDSYAESRLHNYVKNCKGMKVYFDEDTVKRDIKKVKKLVLKSKDYTNFLRATELESKILGMQRDVSENKTLLTVEQKQQKDEALNKRFDLMSNYS